ncbi:phosphatase PAP2 family protein [Streptomyces sp. NPDC053367]|uniref:phosphatase PAP2 family protein n=1 Tax=Streptomyces sp. NPDC053367 TaxID=3365700 RepID=UPI0037D5C74B
MRVIGWLMEVTADVPAEDRRLARRVVGWGPPWVRRCAPVVEEAAEHTKVWWVAATAMAAFGGWRGRRAALAGVTAMAAAEVLSNAVCKQLVERRRPPREWVPPEALDDRPDSSSFPSGHTAAAFAFAGAVAPTWPAMGAVCGASAAVVAAERVLSGAHYPLDVAAGGAIGLAAAALARQAPRRVVARKAAGCITPG